MSVIAMLYAYCDTPDCENSNSAGAESLPGQSRTDFRRELREAGWRRIGGADHCPECIRDRKQSREGERSDG